MNDTRQTFIQNAIEPPPPVIPLLTIIRLTEDVVAEVQRRGCGPLETYIFTLRLKMWPVFQKLMAEHIDALKKFADGASAGYFRRGGTTTDLAVSSVSAAYPTITSHRRPESLLALPPVLSMMFLTSICIAHVHRMAHS